MLSIIREAANKVGGVPELARARLLKRLQESPSLRTYPSEVLDEEYAIARDRTAAETGLGAGSFPAACPYAVDQILDPDFMP